MPAGYFTEDALARLEKLIVAKGSLIKKALGIDAIPIEKTEDRVTFPWFKKVIEDADAANAYIRFVHAICEMACNKSGSAYRKEKWRTKNMHSGVFFSDLDSLEKSTKWSERFCLKILLGPLHLRMGKINKIK